MIELPDILVGGIDFETTGNKVDKDRIVQIGVVVMNLKTGDEKLVIDRLVNPEMNIPNNVVAIHGINNADVLNAPKFAAFAPTLSKLITKLDLIVWHNGDEFDGPLMIHEFDRVGVTLDKLPPAFDTMLKGRTATADGKVPSLGELCYAFDVPYDKALAHDAIYDIRCSLQAFRKGLQLGYFHLDERKVT